MANLVGCRECDHQVSVQAKACPNCGASWPGQPDRASGRPWLIGILIIFGLVVGLAYMRYETITPCGMLQSEIKRYVLGKTLRDGIGDGFEALGTAIGLSMIDTMAEAATASLNSFECLEGLVRIHSEGMPELVAATNPRGSPSAAPQAPPRPAALSMSSFELRNVPNVDLCEAYSVERSTPISNELSRRGRFDERHWSAIRSQTVFVGMLQEGAVCAVGLPDRGRYSSTWAYNTARGPLTLTIEGGRVKRVSD